MLALKLKGTSLWRYMQLSIVLCKFVNCKYFKRTLSALCDISCYITTIVREQCNGERVRSPWCFPIKLIEWEIKFNQGHCSRAVDSWSLFDAHKYFKRSIFADRKGEGEL